MNTYKLLRMMLVAYPLIWGCLLVTTVILFWHFGRTHRASALSGGMLSLSALFYFFVVGRFDMDRNYYVGAIEERFGLAAFSLSLLVHAIVLLLEVIFFKRSMGYVDSIRYKNGGSKVSSEIINEITSEIDKLESSLK